MKLKKISIIISTIIILSAFSSNLLAEVNPNGSFSFHINIKLPPGTKGMEPQLSLDYNSFNKNSILGMGWTMQGVPVITRDTSHSISYNSNDHFAGPEGQLISVGSYYHYRNENYSRFEAAGTQGSGPRYWVETKPDGTKYYYGQTDDSRSIAENHSPSVSTWALNRVEDLHGNYYTIEYSQENGQIYPVKIVYTQGHSISKFRTVEFTYESRNDYHPDYSLGTLVETRKRLKSIIIKTGVTSFLGFNLFGDQARKYELTYTENGTPAISKLTRIQEFDSANNPLQPMEFTWQANQDSDFTYDPDGFEPIPFYGTRNGIWKTGDINGDGMGDAYHISGNAISANILTWFSNGNGTYNVDMNGFVPWTNFSTAVASHFDCGDFNGDGQDDILRIEMTVVFKAMHVMLSNGNGTYQVMQVEMPWDGYDVFQGPWYTCDINGDGRTDLLHVVTNLGLANYIHVWMSNGDGTFSVQPAYTPPAGYNVGGKWFPGDINGDGKTDFTVIGATLDTWISNGDGTFRFNQIPHAIDLNNAEITAGDFNGDGLTDILYVTPGAFGIGNATAHTMFSRGDGSFTLHDFGLSFAINMGRWTHGDYNGDGKTDSFYIQAGSTDSNTFTLISNGNGTFTIYNHDYGINFRALMHEWYSMDVNNDGNTDLFARTTTIYDNTYTLISNRHNGNKITGINTVTGSSITVQYTGSNSLNGVINPADSQYPCIANKAPRELATRVIVNDGRGSSYSTRYEYGRGKVFMAPRPDMKDLFFDHTTRIDEQSGKSTTTTFQQDADHAGLPIRIEHRAGNGSLVKWTRNNYSISTHPNYGTKIIRITSTLTGHNEKGSEIAVVTRSFQYDNYGNVTNMTSQATGCDAISNEVTYNIDESSWILTRPAEVLIRSGGAVAAHKRLIYTGNLLTSEEQYCDTDDKWITTSYTYDNHGNITATTDPGGHVSITVYDDEYFAFPVQKINALGHTTISSFDARYGSLLSNRDANGNTTEYSYDSQGRLIEIQEPGDEWTKRIAYHNIGNTSNQYIETQIADDSSLGYHYQQKYFDGLNRQYRTITKAEKNSPLDLDLIVDTEFNSSGQVSRKSRPYLSGSHSETPLYNSYHYDYAGKISGISYPDGTSETINYAASGNGTFTKSITDKNGNTHQKVYNSLGQLIRKIEPGGLQLNYTYTALNRLASVVNSDSQVTSITWDSLGRKRTVTDPSTGTVVFTYDNSGNMTTKQDAKGQTIQYSYDEINRLTAIDYPGSTPDVQYDYDNSAMANGIGRITAIQDGAGSATVAYTEKGMPAVKTRTIDGETYIFQMEYDSQSRLTGLTYPDGTTITREYSDLGILKAVMWGSSPIVRYGMFRDDSGSGTVDYTVHRVTGNGVHTAISYNSANLQPGEVVTTVNNGVVNETHENITYSFDNAGNITSIADNIDSSRSQALTYDNLNRIISASSASYGSITYEYSSNGNLLKKGNLTLQYNSSNPYAVTGDSDGNSYSYDENGNMTQRRDTDLSYDAANRLTSIEQNGAVLADYTYEHSGSRIKKRLKNGALIYSIDGLFEVMKINARADHYTKYLYGIENELVAQVTETGSTLITADAPSVISGYYASNTLKGLFLRGYAYLNHYSNSIKTYRYFMYFMLIASLLILLINEAYKFIKRNEISFSVPQWTFRAAPVLLFAVITVFGITGCSSINSDGDIVGAAPWSGIVDGNLHSDGTPVEGMYFFHPDYTGNISYLTNSKGEKVCQVRYKPYGEIYEKTGTDTFRYKFNSQIKDYESGLMYYKARYYDPAIGRFITPDSMVPDSESSQAFNRYAYVEGSPLEFRDFTGHSKAGNFFKRIFRPVGNFFKNEFSNFFTKTLNNKVFRPMKDFFKNDVADAFKEVGSFFKGAWKYIEGGVKIIQGILTIVLSFVEAIATLNFTALIQNVIKGVAVIMQGIGIILEEAGYIEEGLALQSTGLLIEGMIGMSTNSITGMLSSFISCAEGIDTAKELTEEQMKDDMKRDLYNQAAGGNNINVKNSRASYTHSASYRMEDLNTGSTGLPESAGLIKSILGSDLLKGGTLLPFESAHNSLVNQAGLAR